MIDTTICLDLLHKWAVNAERYWYPMPDDPQLGCYGTGYNTWGVQTNQKYLGAMAALAVLGEEESSISQGTREWARERALAALRYSLRSHVSGDRTRTDGSRWGHTWISGLGIERMMYGVYLLEPYLAEEDRAGLRRVLTSESDWILHDLRRGRHEGVVAGLWAESGRNVPESNVWNGAILWRAAAMYPDHPQAAAWRESAHRLFINAVSVEDDAQDERVVAGKPIAEWHVGANFFPHYALDHHGYLNVGYMVICLSNAAMLHYDMRAQGLPVPESLYHHNDELWQVVRRMIYSDGRLARIGGDSRIRYAYCQEYLLPTLVYAAEQLGEPHAAHLIRDQLELILGEAAYNGDGSFYGKRLAHLAELSPYYYTRLESDRACALGMLAAYERQAGDTLKLKHEACAAFERSVAGSWCEPEHGAVLHRSPTRLAAFAWRAHGLAQGTCQPPDDGHLAEWQGNLGGYIRFLGDPGVFRGGRTPYRRLADYRIETFEGGYATSGAVVEGVGVQLEEGYRRDESALHQIAFVALPDGHTVVGLEHCRTVDQRTYVAEVKGLHLNLPNDLYNEFQRQLATAEGEVILRSPPERDHVVELHGQGVNIEGGGGVVGLYGAEQLVVDRSAQRRGGRLRSLHVDEICYHCALGTRSIDPGQVILDVGWAVLSSTNGEETARFAESYTTLPLEDSSSDVRGVRVRGLDGRDYVVVANWGHEKATCDIGLLIAHAVGIRDLISGEALAGGLDGALVIGPGRVRAFVLQK